MLANASCGAKPDPDILRSPKMAAKFKNFLFCLAVMAVAAVQLFGAPAGYVCSGTGQRSIAVECEPVVCHPQQQNDAGGCSSESGSPCRGNHGTESPAHDDHTHSVVLEGLKANVFQSVTALPAANFFVLPPSFQPLELEALLVSSVEEEKPEVPEYGTPPMPQLVARTIVMLV